MVPILIVAIIIVTVVAVMLVVAVYHFYLPADLAACRVGKRVHVRIGGAGSDGRDYGREIIRIELLACRAPGYNVLSGDRPGEVVRPRIARMGRWTLICRGLTKPDDDAAIHA